MFGSARTLPDDPLYVQACELAADLAATGLDGRDRRRARDHGRGHRGGRSPSALGVNIRLPFEEADHPSPPTRKLVVMKYFFTRKLMLMKESAGFAVLPGGFGTLDEAFELLTLLQTGKAAPAPIVLLDVPGGTYWRAWERFVRDEVVAPGLVSAATTSPSTGSPTTSRPPRPRSSASTATTTRSGTWASGWSSGSGPSPPPTSWRASTGEFADICREGRIEAAPPLPAEVGDDDHVELPRIVLHFDRSRQGRLRMLIDALNRLPSAPPPILPGPDVGLASARPTDEEEDG